MRAKPAYATARDTRFDTYGPRFERHYTALTGHKFMPWQKDLLAVALEHDAGGILRYPTVMVLVPRQSGKSDLLHALHVGRCCEWGDQGILALAQDRLMARVHVIDGLLDTLLMGNATYDGSFTARRQNGAELIRFHNGSWIRIAANTTTASHGLTIDLASLDEVWSHEDFRPLQALSPAMITRQRKLPGAQMFLVSTEGVADSIVLDHFKTLGRDSVSDPNAAMCYLEYSMPEGADPYDEKRWGEWMPALGKTISIDAVRNIAGTMPEPEFLRAMCNVRTSVLDSVFAVGQWEACGDDDNSPAGGLCASVDITPDRARACIVVCGGGCVEVIEDRAGTDWLVARLLELDARWNFDSIAIDNAGPAISIISEIEYSGRRVNTVDAHGLKAACGRFYDAVVSGQLRHRNQPALDEAVRAARKRNLLDAWAWTRKGSTYISPVVAATLAYYAWAEQPVGAVTIW